MAYDLESLTSMSKKRRVIIVDDEPEIRERLRKLFSDSNVYDLVGEGASCADLLKHDLKSCDLIILDIGLPEVSGLDCLQKIREQNMKVKVMMYTVFEDEDHLMQAIQLGASGYLLKETTPELLLAELDVLFLGGAPLTSRIATSILGRVKNKQPTVALDKPLSEREIQVLNLIAIGLKYQEIADELDISGHTVRRYIERIYQKLNVNTRGEALRRGKQYGLVDE